MSREKGFTIVEMLIVLAIGGLILLIVFLAIPQLQRSSRNDQRRQDVQTILQAVSHYELNDSGNFPNDCGGSGYSACTASAGGSTPNDFFLHFSAKELTFYTGSDQVLARNQPANLSTNSGYNDLEAVRIFNHKVCNGNDGGATGTSASYSDIVAQYAIENGSGGAVPQCQQL